MSKSWWAVCVSICTNLCMHITVCSSRLENQIKYVYMPITSVPCQLRAPSSLVLMPHTQPSIPPDWFEESSTPIKDNKPNKALGKTSPHPITPVWRRAAFNSLLHNYCFVWCWRHAHNERRPNSSVPSIRANLWAKTLWDTCKNTHAWNNAGLLMQTEYGAVKAA